MGMQEDNNNPEYRLWLSNTLKATLAHCRRLAGFCGCRLDGSSVESYITYSSKLKLAHTTKLPQAGTHRNNQLAAGKHSPPEPTYCGEALTAKANSRRENAAAWAGVGVGLVRWASFSLLMEQTSTAMAEFKHSFNRRCKIHDYRSRCIYMITILKSAKAPLFSSITRDLEKPKISPLVKAHPAGQIIYECLSQLCIDHPSLRILRSIVMPDHIHFELFVTERTEIPLGSLIAVFKAACTKKFKVCFPESLLAKENLSLFESGFNDKIATRAAAKDAFYNYIADNPRRYLVKKLCPEYFFQEFPAPPKQMNYAHAQELNAIAAAVALMPPCSANLHRRL